MSKALLSILCFCAQTSKALFARATKMYVITLGVSQLFVRALHFAFLI